MPRRSCRDAFQVVVTSFNLPNRAMAFDGEADVAEALDAGVWTLVDRPQLFDPVDGDIHANFFELAVTSREATERSRTLSHEERLLPAVVRGLLSPRQRPVGRSLSPPNTGLDLLYCGLDEGGQPGQ